MVKMMREIREEVSGEIMDMTYEEERAYLDKLLSTSEENEKASGSPPGIKQAENAKMKQKSKQ